MRSWAQSHHVNVGFVVGVGFVLLTYLVVSQQGAISGPKVVATVTQWMTNKQLIDGPGEKAAISTTEKQPVADKQLVQGPGETVVTKEAQQQIVDKQQALGNTPSETDKTKVVCDTESFLSEHCEIDGDVRINGSAQSVTIVPTGWSELREWKIRPYSRKSATNVERFNVTELQAPDAAPPCTVTHHTPAVLFALGGYTDNTFHDHADVLLPLFVASRRYDGEVQLLVTNSLLQPWWLGKYKLVFQRLSKYELVRLDGDAHVRCFRHLTVGLHMHRDFGVVPEWAPGGRRLSMADFTRFMREAYALPRGEPVSPAREPDKKPRLMLIQRKAFRRFLNLQEIVQAAEAAGFEVVVMDLRRETPVDEQARVVNSFDAMLGVHGAGMTNELFLPPGGVLIQVVPWGKLDYISRIEYGEPATAMGLLYLCYNVTVEESSLLETLGPEHAAVKDPDSIHSSGWAKVAEYYLQKQDVRLNITRIGRTLAQAMEHLRQL